MIKRQTYHDITEVDSEKINKKIRLQNITNSKKKYIELLTNSYEIKHLLSDDPIFNEYNNNDKKKLEIEHVKEIFNNIQNDIETKKSINLDLTDELRDEIENKKALKIKRDTMLSKSDELTRTALEEEKKRRNLFDEKEQQTKDELDKLKNNINTLRSDLFGGMLSYKKNEKKYIIKKRNKGLLDRVKQIESKITEDKQNEEQDIINREKLAMDDNDLMELEKKKRLDDMIQPEKALTTEEALTIGQDKKPLIYKNKHSDSEYKLYLKEFIEQDKKSPNPLLNYDFVFTKSNKSIMSKSDLENKKIFERMDEYITNRDSRVQNKKGRSRSLERTPLQIEVTPEKRNRGRPRKEESIVKQALETFEKASSSKKPLDPTGYKQKRGIESFK
jgi:hypothetical protein